MAENLKVSHYQNGDAIEYYDYDNDPSNSEIYGRLYDWYAVDDDRGVCPEGWHVPFVENFNQLINYLGGLNKAGMIKDETSWDGTNETGFSALPSGVRHFNTQAFYGRHETTYIWLNYTEDSNEMINEVYSVGGSAWHWGLSIHCLKD